MDLTKQKNVVIYILVPFTLCPLHTFTLCTENKSNKYTE